MCVLGTSIEDDGLDTAHLLVRLCHVSFVLEVSDATHTAQDELCLLLFREIDGQAVIDGYPHTRFVGEDLANRLFALADRERLTFGAVTTNTDDDLVKQPQAA